MSEVIVYSGTDCDSCKQLKQVLVSKGVEFKEINVKEDEDAMQLLLSKGLRGLPKVQVDGEFVSSYMKWLVTL